MLIDTKRYPLTGRCPQSAPDPAREDVLNQLCTVREDPRFAEWCRLTSALGLDSLMPGQLAALHAAADTIFPEVGEPGRPDVDGFAQHPFDGSAPFGFDGRDWVSDAVLDDGAATMWRADGVPAPGVGMPEACVVMDDGVFDGRFGDSSTHDGRGK